MEEDLAAPPNDVHSNKRQLRGMDSLPVDVIGNILSHVCSARHVAMASGTSRKWRDAAKHHLHKLTFSILDWRKNNDPSSDCDSEEEMPCNECENEFELIVTETVMQTTCLRELSIDCMTNKDDVRVIAAPVCGDDTRIHAISVVAWLLHTKQTLKSLTLMAPMKPSTNILGKLAGGARALERLVWGCAYISALKPNIHSLPCLVSLTINKVEYGLTCDNFQLLVSMFPKLETLHLCNIRILLAPSTVELNISPSLKTLHMELFLFDSANNRDIVLHGGKLQSLSLIQIHFRSLDWGQREHLESLQYLLIQHCHIARVRLGDNLQYLMLWDASIEELEIGSLSSLLELELIAIANFERAWQTNSQVIEKASSKLRKLHMAGGLSLEGPILDVDMIVSSFPCLNWLSLDYQNAFFQEYAHVPHVLEHVAVLELHTRIQATDHEGFVQWILAFLKRCPNLKCLSIVTEASALEDSDKSTQFVGKLASRLIHLMRPYPHVDVDFEIE